MRWCQSVDSLEGMVAAVLAVIKELVKAAVAPAVPEGHVEGAAAAMFGEMLMVAVCDGGIWLAKRMRPIRRPDIVGGEVGKWIRQGR